MFVVFLVTAAVLGCAIAYAADSIAKSRFTRDALKDVPADQRVPVINALGHALQRWGQPRTPR